MSPHFLISALEFCFILFSLLKNGLFWISLRLPWNVRSSPQGESHTLIVQFLKGSWIKLKGPSFFFYSPWSMAYGCHNKLSDLKQHAFILLQLWKSEVWNQFHWTQIWRATGPCSPRGSGRECIALLSSVSRATFLAFCASYPLPPSSKLAMEHIASHCFFLHS